MNKIFFFISLLIPSFYAFDLSARQSVTDSLENILSQNMTEDTNRVNLLNDFAYKLYQIDVNKTFAYAEEAVEISEKLNYKKGLSEGMRMTGIYYLLRGNYALASEYFENALEIAEKIDDKYLISKIYNNIGLIYDFYGEYEKELEYYKKAIEINKQIGNKKGMAVCYSNIGLTYVSAGNYSDASDYLKKSLSIYEETGDRLGIARSYNNMGRIYEYMNNDTEAWKYYLKSLELSRETGAKSTEAEVEKDIGNFYLGKNNFKKAVYYTKNAYGIAENIRETALLIECARILASSYAKMEIFEEAYNYQVIFKNLTDSLYNEENSKKIAEIEYQYKYEQEKQALEAEQKKKDIIREAEAESQRMIRNFFIAGFLLMFVSGVVVFISFLQKRKANRVLAFKNDQIEKTNDELNSTNEKLNTLINKVSHQKEEIEKNRDNINSSISYAGRIQKALLPDGKFFKESFDSHFILYKPKDIVSGDFYFFKKIKNNIIIAAADCTGHGVPGAFVSMLGIAFLNELVRQEEITDASKVLEALRIQVKTTLTDNVNEDGMDIAICVIDTRTNMLQFSGASMPLYILRNKNLNEFHSVYSPIGINYKYERTFKNIDFQLQENDTIYLFSDGYSDQFGGKNDKKFNLSRFRKLLISIQGNPMSLQKEMLNQAIEDWKGNSNNQTDDILVIGLKI